MEPSVLHEVILVGKPPTFTSKIKAGNTLGLISWVKHIFEETPWHHNQILHVTSVYFNPFNSLNRLETFKKFKDHISHLPNVQLHVVEVAFGDLPFVVSTDRDVQLRTKDVLWVKENAINIGVAHFPKGWKYGAYVDGDFLFTRQDWALETIKKLQHYDWVQPFSGYAFMSSDHRPLTVRPSFAYTYHNYYGGNRDDHNKRSGPHSGYHQPDPDAEHRFLGAVGGAWAFTNKSFAAVNGLLELCVLGAADWHMAFGFIGADCSKHVEYINCHDSYKRVLAAWQKNAYKEVKGNIGYVDCLAIHAWHGDVSKRGYDDRWEILKKYDYNPYTDLTRDKTGLLKWAKNKPEFHDAVRTYFLSRDEDNPVAKFKPIY